MRKETAFDIINPSGQFPLILTCEHASCSVPTAYGNLGLSGAEIRRHIGWDIGARAVVQSLTQSLDVAAVCAGYSRLLIDCNRALHDHDLIVHESDGTKVPGNHNISEGEQHKRIRQFYEPYHAAIDQLIAAKGTQRVTVLSIHSFTPILGKKDRLFDLGVLFDRYDDVAREVGQRLHHSGYRVRYNEPYSGYDGLIFSARSHGERHQLVYLELEMNNSLLTHPEGVRGMSRAIRAVLLALFSEKQNEKNA